MISPDDLQILPANQDLVNAVLDEGWLRDEEINRGMGAGKGLVGQHRALQKFEHYREIRAIHGIWMDAEPVGLVALIPIDEEGKTLRVDMLLPPEQHHTGLAPAALEKLLEDSFSNGTHRVETCVLRINKDAVAFARHMGFTQEGVLFDYHWMDDNPYDVVVLRMLRREWSQLREMSRRERRQAWVQHREVRPWRIEGD